MHVHTCNSGRVGGWSGCASKYAAPPAREPRVARRERNDAAELVPDARLGRPLRPRVPGIERSPGHFEPQQDEAQRDPAQQQPPGESRGPFEPGRAGERAQRGAQRARQGRVVATPRVNARSGGDREQRRRNGQRVEGDTEKRQHAHPERQQQRADEVAGHPRATRWRPAPRAGRERADRRAGRPCRRPTAAATRRRASLRPR